MAGGIAGLVVDVSLFPLDTFKTRLQSSQGFLKSGGFHNVYKGIGPQVIGSMPMAAVFFCAYESFKHFVEPGMSQKELPIVHMIGATIAEVATCLLKVPVEIIKQRQQTSNKSSMEIILKTYQTEGFVKGFYRGYRSTVYREVPFALVQFPIFEYLKLCCRRLSVKEEPLSTIQVALCGAIAGGISAAVTTPLDAAKTRIMLATKSESSTNDLRVSKVLRRLYKTDGFKGLFAGFIPRIIWITIGGAVFFGTYDLSRSLFLTCYKKTRNQL